MTVEFRNLNWREEYSVGVPLLDNQHKEILKSIQKVTDFNTKTDDSNVFSDSIEYLTRLMSNHFKDEEDYLSQKKYPFFNDHKKSHLKLMDGYSELLYRLSKGDKGVDKKLVKFLHNWWVNHIFEEDMKFRDFFKKSGSTPSNL